MTVQKQREIVIEIEKVQLIRKRAKTLLRHCGNCGTETDFVGSRSAAELFGIKAGELKQFVMTNAVHYTNDEFDTAICIPSLLAVMRARINGNGIKLITARGDRDQVEDTTGIERAE
jgi:hypothetical protein